MESASILVFTQNENSELVEFLFNLGYVPLIQSQILSILKEIKHRTIRVVFLDLKHVGIDSLEFILNVRDIDQELPIVIANGKFEGETEINQLKNIFLISTKQKQIQQILRGLNNQ